MHLEAQRDMAERERRHQRDIQVLLRREGLNNSLDRGDAARELRPSSSSPAARVVAAEHHEGGKDEHLEAQRRLEMLQEQIGMLDKDNFYYKQSNSNLKRRLRELSAAGEQASLPLLLPPSTAPPL